MCFGGPKMKAPKVQKAAPIAAAPIADQTPTVETGADTADANRSKKKASQSGLSLFQIQLLPGATTTSADEPGAATGGV